MHYMMNPDPYRGPFGNDGAAYAAQVTASGPLAVMTVMASQLTQCTPAAPEAHHDSAPWSCADGLMRVVRR